MPALPLPASELQPFADAVLRRFANPYLHHRLSSIALNSWAKFAARVMPQLLRYQQLRGRLPPHLVLALAATVRLYRGDLIPLADEPALIEALRTGWQAVDDGSLTLTGLVRGMLGRHDIWGRDLHTVPGLTDAVAESLAQLQQHGIRACLAILDQPAG